MEHKGTVTLQTERLILRQFRMEDAQPFFDNWARDPEVTRYLSWPAHIDVCVTRMVLETWIAQYENPDYYNWAICLKETGEPIGSLNAVSHQRTAEALTLGYCLGKSWWGRGYMPEAVRAVEGFLFCQVGARRIEAGHDTRNPASGRVMEKCGMQAEGILRQAGMSNAGPGDIRICSILRQEFTE